ncbi:MAG: hypothetical protein IKD01_06285 [Oscillospiraceae bacterium]|nr:hypothetical protein [Oscillospiraceae bacterium]
MNTIKLKNIIIAILALLNALLLALSVTGQLQKQEAYDRSVRELTALYEANGLSLRAESLPRSVELPLPSAVRDSAAEANFARALIPAAGSVDSGGGIYRYYNVDNPAAGECLFRSSGAIEASLQQATEDPAAFCRDLCSEFGYTEFHEIFDGFGGSSTAIRTFDGFKVYNCSLHFSFDGTMLRSVSGTFLPRIPLGDERLSVDLITALTRFLDYRNSAGLVCTEVRGVDCGYLLQPTASTPLQLVPVAHVSTDVNDYYVNLFTYDISRDNAASIMTLSAE